MRKDTDPHAAPLSRALVLSTALDIVDEDGVAGLSMRRLGSALDRDPMSLYRYAASKAALLDGVAELVLEKLFIDPTDDQWESQLRTMARTYRDLALAHPQVVPLLVTRPLATPLALRPVGTLRPLEHVLELLTHAGFSTVDALHIYRSLIGLLQGHILNELQELVDNPEETDDLLRLGLHRLPLKDFPLLRSLGPAPGELRRGGRARTRHGQPAHRRPRHLPTPHRRRPA